MSHETSGINRRDALRAAGAATLGLAAGAVPGAQALASSVPLSVLLFAKLSDLPAGLPSESIGELTALVIHYAKANGINLTVATDGAALTPAGLAGYDLVIFYTTGNLMIESAGGNPISAEGKAALVQLIALGKAFIVEHVGLRAAVNNAPATGATAAAKIVADVKLMGNHFAGIVSGQSKAVCLADQHVHVRGLAIGKTPLPLRSISLQAMDAPAPHKARPVLNVLMSNGGTMLKSTLRVAVA